MSEVQATPVPGRWLSDGERVHYILPTAVRTVCKQKETKELKDPPAAMPACEECQSYIFTLGLPLVLPPLWPEPQRGGS